MGQRIPRRTKSLAVAIFLAIVALPFVMFAAAEVLPSITSGMAFLLIPAPALPLVAMICLQIVAAPSWPDPEQKRANRSQALRKLWWAAPFLIIGVPLLMSVPPAGILLILAALGLILLVVSTLITGLPSTAIFNAMSKTTIANATGELIKIPGVEIAPQYEEEKGSVSLFQFESLEPPAKPAESPLTSSEAEATMQFLATLSDAKAQPDTAPT